MIRLVLRHSKPYLKELIISIVSIVLESILEITCPYLMSLLLEYGIEEQYGTYQLNVEVLITISTIMITFGILAFIFGFIFAKYLGLYSKGVAYEIRRQEYLKLKDYSFHNLDNISTSSLLTRLTTDVNILGDTISTSFRPLFRAPVMLISTFILSLIASPQLSLIFLIAIPLLTSVMVIIVRYVKPKFIKIQGIVDKLNKNTKETIVSIKTIKSYVKEDYEKERFDKINLESRKTANQALRVNQLMMPINELILYGTVVSILYLGAYLSLNPDFSSIIINISLFLTYTTQILATIQMLINVTLQFNRAEASSTRIQEMFDVNSEIIDNGDPTLKLERGDIEFKNVSFSYFNDENYVINNLNFKINHNDFIGIIGQTGSSKTTLINLILRFYDISKGQILIDGKNIKDYTLNEVRENISVSFQNPFLFNDTILNNIKWGNKDASMEDVIKACKIACCYDFIVNDLENGFDTVLSEGGTNLSGGQRQRVCLARAILLEPKILILDDSFSALDRVTEAKVKKNLKNNLKNTTKIVISQKISTIKDSDMIIVLEKGNITNIGKHNYLKDKDDIYRDIYEVQNEGL